MEITIKEFNNRFPSPIHIFNHPALKRRGVNYDVIYGKSPLVLYDLKRIIEDIKRNGIVLPIVISQDGFVIDGYSRLTALSVLSIDGDYKIPIEILPINCSEEWAKCVKIALSTMQRKGDTIYGEAYRLLSPILKSVGENIDDIEAPPPSVLPTKLNIDRDAIINAIKSYNVPDPVKELAIDWVKLLNNPKLRYYASDYIAQNLLLLALTANCYGAVSFINSTDVRAKSLLLVLRGIPGIGSLVAPDAVRARCAEKINLIVSKYSKPISRELLINLLKNMKKTTPPVASATIVYSLLARVRDNGGNVKITQRDAASMFDVSDISIRNCVKYNKKLLEQFVDAVLISNNIPNSQ